MIEWMVLGERPLGSYKALNRDDAIHEARRLYGWDVWSVSPNGNATQWTAFTREVRGTVLAHDKRTAEKRALDHFGEGLTVQSAASYAVSQDADEQIRRRIEVKDREWRAY